VPIFRPHEQRAVREHLATLERPVELALVTGPEPTPVPGSHEPDFAGQTLALLEELAALSDLVTVSVHESPAFGAELFPAVCVLRGGEDAGLRYYGLPWGYELTSIVGACVAAGRAESDLRPESVEALSLLQSDLSVDVFVTPT
jgi:alkyl hydroperoxide reductase subunit AhpF